MYSTIPNPDGFLQVIDGSAAAPSISAINDSDTGFYFPGANIVNFTAGGVHSLMFQGSGVFRSAPGFDLNLGTGNQGTNISLRNAGGVEIVTFLNQNIILSPNGTGYIQLGTTGNQQVRSASGDFLLHAQGGRIRLTSSAGVGEYPGINLFGTTTNSSNGTIQIVSHTTSAGGIGFGTDISLHRRDANTLNIVTAAGTSGLVITTSGGERGQILGSGSDLIIDNRTAIGSIIFRTNVTTTALTLDSSQNATFASLVTAARFQASASVAITAKSRFTSATDGVMMLSNNAETDFNRLQFGGTTSAFPSIKRNGAAFDLRLADDSNFCAINVSGVVFSSLGNITFPADGISLIRNNAGTDFGRLQFGGTTSSFPSLKRAGTGLQLRNGDDTAYTQLRAHSVVLNSGTTLADQSDGVATIWNAANTDFSRLQFGGTTSSFPALKRSTTQLHVRLADDTNFADLYAASFVGTSSLTLALVSGSGSPTITGTGYHSSVPPAFNFQQAAGTATVPSAILSGKTIGRISFSGYNGSAFSLGARIFAQSTEAWSGSAQGTELAFQVTANGATTAVTVATLTSTGWNGTAIGATTPSTGAFTTLSVSAAAATVGAGVISYGATTATTVGASGAASALPANPLGYIIINVAGTAAKIPYYNN